MISLLMLIIGGMLGWHAHKHIDPIRKAFKARFGFGSDD